MTLFKEYDLIEYKRNHISQIDEQQREEEVKAPLCARDRERYMEPARL